jgi:N-acetyl-anhydromuramyl-L-alanine amidase AmpD
MVCGDGILARALCALLAFALAGCSLPSIGTNDAGGHSAQEIRKSLRITEDFREQFIHGEKGSSFQKYVVLHDSEGKGTATELIDWWAGNDNRVATHFVVNKDGSIVQCVPIDAIAHHAGFGNTGNNAAYGVEDESRDDRVGTVWLGDWAADYGMNSYSIGIAMVHAGEPGEEYPEEQLRSVDGLIAYIDAYYGFQSQIIEHRDWRTDCESCSAEFAPYLESYKQTRTHDGLTGAVSPDE